MLHLGSLRNMSWIVKAGEKVKEYVLYVGCEKYMTLILEDCILYETRLDKVCHYCVVIFTVWPTYIFYLCCRLDFVWE